MTAERRLAELAVCAGGKRLRTRGETIKSRIPVIKTTITSSVKLNPFISGAFSQSDSVEDSTINIENVNNGFDVDTQPGFWFNGGNFTIDETFFSSYKTCFCRLQPAVRLLFLS